MKFVGLFDSGARNGSTQNAKVRNPPWIFAKSLFLQKSTNKTTAYDRILVHNSDVTYLSCLSFLTSKHISSYPLYIVAPKFDRSWYYIVTKISFTTFPFTSTQQTFWLMHVNIYKQESTESLRLNKYGKRNAKHVAEADD